ncbi:MAG: type I-C CRISPR-associated protein Cas8c/Csd1 [Myxococcales bacterium]|nr:type I-C CRISPR-associated protein Cas8c/Csd1 [Myxococcales bacterium]
MLHALVEYAERKGLMEDTAFVMRPVSFVIVLDADGKVVQVQSNFDERGKAREKRVPVPPLGRTVAVKSGFLVDNAQYALGQPKKVDEDTEAKQKAGEDKAKRNADERALAFAESVNEALRECDDDGLRALSRFCADLDAQRARVHAIALVPAKGAAKKGAKKAAKKGAKKADAQVESEPAALVASEPHVWSGDETIAFALDTDRGMLVHERESVAAWWRKRVSAQSDEGTVARCVVTGDVSPMVKLHPALKRVPEAQSSGAFLVSFNAAAFRSWGFEQGENAPMSSHAATAYARAINAMLSEDKGRGRRFRQGVQVADDSVMIYWSKPAEGANEGPELEDVIVDLLDSSGGASEADPESYRRQIDAVWKHLEVVPLDDVSRFYAATLGSNASRVVVRDWFETTAAEVKRNVQWWFESLLVGEPRDPAHPWRPPTVRELLRVMQSRPEADGDKGGLSSALAARLVRSALYGEPLGAEFLRAALARIRLPSGDGTSDRRALDVRMGLIRACLRRPAWTERREVTVALNPKNTEVSYVLGRLFSVLESLQLQAQGQDLNASIRDKFFASASTTPAAVFGPLLQRAQHHIAKLDNGAADRELGEVMDLLDGAPLPAVLNLEQQGLFALGYYHQRSHTFRRIAEAKEAKRSKAEATGGN